MKFKLSLIFLLLTKTVSFGQDGDAVLYAYLDSLVSEMKLTNKIETDKISAILIYSGDNALYGVGKGFMIDWENYSDTINNFTPTLTSSDSCNIRLVTFPYTDSLCIIKYKWYGSTAFFEDTCYLFHDRYHYIAFSKANYTKDIISKTVTYWYLGPSSTEERQVVKIYRDDENRTLFCRSETY